MFKWHGVKPTPLLIACSVLSLLGIFVTTTASPLWLMIIPLLESMANDTNVD